MDEASCLGTNGGSGIDGDFFESLTEGGDVDGSSRWAHTDSTVITSGDVPSAILHTEG